MKKPIHIAASPNVERDDVMIAIRNIFRPWSWESNKHIGSLKGEISSYFETEDVCLFDSGRSAITAVLHGFGIGAGDEVLVHAFTCLVVANPVSWVGAKPIFVDVNPKNFNFDIDDLKRKITSRTRAVIVQHSFGIPEDIDVIRKIVGAKVMIIEDLAHSLGSSFKGRKLGINGDATILTFGIEKVISSVRGGAGIIFNKDAMDKMMVEYLALPSFPRGLTFIALLNPIFWWLVLPVYYFGFGVFTLGRMKVFLAHRIGLLGRMIEKSEYGGSKPKWMPAKISPALAELGLNQWKKMKKLNTHRENISKIYSQELGVNYDGATSLLRFPVLVKNRAELIKTTKAKGIVLGDWYKKILYAPQETLDHLGYKAGSCPNAEKIKDQIVNLPTYIGVKEKDAKVIANMVRPFLN